MTRLRRFQEESTGKLRVQTGLHGDKLTKYCTTVLVICLMSVRVSCGAGVPVCRLGDLGCRSDGGLAPCLCSNSRYRSEKRRTAPLELDRVLGMD